MIKKNSIYVFPEKNFAPEKSEQFLKQMLKPRTPNVLMFALLIGKSMLGEDFFFVYFFFRLLKVNYVDKRKDKKLLVSVHL